MAKQEKLVVELDITKLTTQLARAGLSNEQVVKVLSILMKVKKKDA